MAGVREAVLSELEEKEINAKSVLVQLPEGLKGIFPEIKRILTKKGVEKVGLVLDPTYGACDVREREAEAGGYELILHVGHAPLYTTSVPTVFLEGRVEYDWRAVADLIRGKVKEKNINLCSTVTFLRYFDEIAGTLSKDREVFIGKGCRCPYPGMILGCDFWACGEEGEANVVLADGLFHAIGARLATGRRTYLVDPLTLNVKDVEDDARAFLKKRLGSIYLAKDCKRFGVIVSSKKGQNRRFLAEKIANKLISLGYDADLLISDYLFPEYLSSLPYDCYVFTGCPRVVDEAARFEKPILTPSELLLVLGEHEDYRMEDFCALGSFL